MRNILFLAFLAGVVSFTACQSEGIKTEHGYRFINHTDKGGVKPQPGETVMVNHDTYVGDSLLASTLKSLGGPREYNIASKESLPERVPALYDALLLMGEGDSATTYETIDTFLRKFIPESLKDAKEVRYEIVLVDVISKAEKDKEQAEAEAKFQSVQNKAQETVKNYASGNLSSQLTTTASGLKVLIDNKGAGAPVKQGEGIKVHYYGCLKDGNMFDNSYQRGQPYPFPAGVGQMIPGFDEGVMLLNHGGSGFFFIPSKLGYGDQPAGQIPPNSELIFYVEVI
jgi:FKBP-type peptidyl-prolyl cis-trans isomerase FkpA